MMTELQQADAQYTTYNLNIAEVYSDDHFNCRGQIAPVEVADLAQSIEKNGLQFPITVQPVGDVKDGDIPPGFKYRIVAGHRRFMACRVLGWKTVPAMVREGLDHITARVLNLTENFERKDLNILQEAYAIKALKDAGVGREHVAPLIGKSGGWVQARFNLLDLPEDIQKEAAAGMITQFHIKQLFTLRDKPDQLYEAVRKVKEAKAKGEDAGRIAPRKAKPTNTKKARKKDEIFDMMGVISDAAGYGLHLRALAWAAGEITTDDLFTDIKEYCQENNKPDFYPPLEF